MSDNDDFDWDGVEVDIPHQARIAVYTNPEGHIVIRQDGDWYRRDDGWIVVLPENARRLADAILALAEPIQAPALALPAPVDRTAAERQRRHRERRRNGPCDRDTVTTNRDARDSSSGKELFEAD